MLGSSSRNEKLMQDERQGKMLLHTEFSLLSLLKNQPGVIQQHGMFSVSDLLYINLMAMANCCFQSLRQYCCPYEHKTRLIL